MNLVIDALLVVKSEYFRITCGKFQKRNVRLKFLKVFSRFFDTHIRFLLARLARVLTQIEDTRLLLEQKFASSEKKIARYRMKRLQEPRDDLPA